MLFRSEQIPVEEVPAEEEPVERASEEAEEETSSGEAPVTAEEVPAEEPEKPLWSEIFTSVDINWDAEAAEDAEPQIEEVSPPENESGLPETGAIDDSGRDTPFGPAPAREEDDSDLSLIKSLFADMGDLGQDVVGAVAPNVEPEEQEPAFEHFDFDWSQEIPEPEAPAIAPEDMIKEGEKVFDRAVKIDDEEELKALLSAEELLNQKVSKLKEDKHSGKKGGKPKKNNQGGKEGGTGEARKEKKYHLSDKRKKRK